MVYLLRLRLCWRRLTNWKMRTSSFYMELQMVRFCSTSCWKFILVVVFPVYSVCACVCVYFGQSEGTLSAQCWAPEPTGEGRSQLLTTAVPRRGPHLEGSAQHPALPADSCELPPKLLEAQHLPRSYRGWGRRRWLRPEPLAFFLKDSSWTVCHLKYYLGSDYQAHKDRSGDQVHQITSCNFEKNWCMIYWVAHNYFHCYTVCFRPCLFTKFS